MTNSNSRTSFENDCREEVLRTLSFLESYSLERLIMEFDDSFLAYYPEFSKADLQSVLEKLVSQGLILEEKKENGEIVWKKLMPREQKSSWYHHLLRAFKKALKTLKLRFKF